MGKETINYNCGHSREMNLTGKHENRDRYRERMESEELRRG